MEIIWGYMGSGPKNHNKGMVFGTRVLKYWILGTSGYSGEKHEQRFIAKFRT